jgi:adenine-specific DNA-methyltransferase
MPQKTNPTLNLKTDLPSVEEYEFEPIKGYPMLHWKGKRPFYSTQFYPAQLKEQFGEEVDGWMNQIFWGDNLQVMSHLLKKYRGKVDLIYIDPPFDSKADYKKKIQLKGKQVTNDSTAFEEKQYTDIWSNDEYLQFMYERLILMRELLSDTGSIYLHCDTNRGHYLKCILDEIFGNNNSRSEIIWQRTFSHSDANRFGTIHDNIHHYSKSDNFLFNKQYKPHSEEYIKSHYSQQDSDGRKFRLVTLSAAGAGPARQFGDKVIAPPPGRHWAWSQDRIDKGLLSGKLVFAKLDNQI